MIGQLTGAVSILFRGFYALNTGDQWLTMTLDFIGALLSFLVSMLVVALKGQLGPSRSALILERVYLAPFPAADHLYVPTRADQH